MRSCRFILITFFFCLPASAQWQSIGNVDSFSTPRNNKITLHSGTGEVQIEMITADMARVRLAPSGTFEPDHSWAVMKRDWSEISVRIVESKESIDIGTDELSIRVNRKPLRLSFCDKSGNLLNEDEPSKGMSWNGNEVRVWKTMPLDEHYIGFGEKAGRLQRKFTHMTMWNSDIPAYKADTDPLYQSIPFFYGINDGRAYGIFFHNSYWSSFDMGKESRNQYSFGAVGGEIDYYFFFGPSPSKILSRFTELVGRMPLPPRWSLGYQQCRWSYPNEMRVREIARGFRDRNIPCDVIYLDIDYMEGYRIFTWNRERFPQPKQMIADLSHDGFRIAVIVDPGIKTDTGYHAYRTGLAGDHFLKYPDGRLFIGKVWPGECAFPDFTSIGARKWWGDSFSMLVNDGVRGWWNDMNEPSVFDVPTKTVDLSVIHDDNGMKTTHAKNHNVYGMLMTQATYEGIRKLLPNERPFVLTRASYAGGQRYSAAWTGDNIASWEHLEMAIPMCLNLSISGQPFVGTDIGGFIGYPSGELFARWLQLGVFTPLMRAHSVTNEKNKEPWEYGEEFTTINRQTINLRYQLLPYIYNAMYHASVTGIPPMRPLCFEYPEEAAYIWNDEEFMFGNDLLVAPVLEEGSRTRRLRLPKGVWYDYWTGQKYQGESDVSVSAPLDRIPFFVKAGAVLPAQQVVQYVDQQPVDPLMLTVYPTTLQSTSTYYEDDGLTFEHGEGRYFRRTITQWNSSSAITVTLSKPEGSYVSRRKFLELRFIDFPSPPKAVEADGKKLETRELAKQSELKQGWTYDGSKKMVLVKIQDISKEQRLTVLK